jgi:AcrR family transcriptional regulator
MPRPLSLTARRKMLRATQELLGVQGLDACTIDEVARRSGVAKTTIYRHFGSVDELALAAIGEMIEEIAVPDLGSIRADLRAVIDGFRALVPQDAFRRLFASMLLRAVTDPEFARLHERAQESRHVPLRLAIQRGIARGEVDPDIDIDTAMYVVQGPFVAKRLIESGELSDRDVDAFLDVIVRALAPRRDA